MITIHYDFTDGTELSYEEGLKAVDDFTTNCLSFFNNHYQKDTEVKVLRKNGKYLLKNEILSDKNPLYTPKQMRNSHDLERMLKANSFTWQEPKDTKGVANCIVCGKELKRIGVDMVAGGTILNDTINYGSIHDSDKIKACICDDCITKKNL